MFGTQYRSAIFYSSEEQKRIAQAYVDQLNQAKVFPRAIATQIVTLNAILSGGGLHQDYGDNHPKTCNIVINDLPKVEHLHKAIFRSSMWRRSKEAALEIRRADACNG